MECQHIQTGREVTDGSFNQRL